MSARQQFHTTQTHDGNQQPMSPEHSHTQPLVVTDTQMRRLFWRRKVERSVQEAFEFRDLVAAGVTAEHVLASSVGASTLQRVGASRAGDLKRLGFSAVHLNDEAWCTQMIAAYGADDVREAYLCDASDAVAICDSPAQVALGVSAQELIELCAGAPQQAVSILQHLPVHERSSVSIKALLDAGVRQPALSDLGLGFAALAKRHATRQQLELLGFRW